MQIFNLMNNQNINNANNETSNEQNTNTFLQKKRKLQEYSSFNYNNKTIEEKKQTLIKNECVKTKKFIRPKNIKKYKNLEKLKDNKIKNGDENKKNINKIENNLKDFSTNYKKLDFNIAKNEKDINRQNDNIDKIKFSSIPINNNKNINLKKDIFFVSHDEDFCSKLINKNNQFKVFKNRKIVYVNSCILNSQPSSRNIKQVKNIAFITKNKRSSKYRGVSKNGNKWQVLFMNNKNNKNKTYVYSYTSEEVAARIYDILSIKKKGINARTNFTYNSLQINKIKEMVIDVKAENINEFINQLF